MGLFIFIGFSYRLKMIKYKLNRFAILFISTLYMFRMLL